MGANTSSLTEEELHELKSESNFTGKEIIKLYERFMNLDRAKKGFISSSDLELIPELCMNPLCHRIISVFSGDNNLDQINFRRFVQTLSILSPKAKQKQKLRLAFEICDVDNDGWINDRDLYHILKMLVGSNLDDKQLELIVNKTFTDSDHDKDGKISFDDFGQVVGDKVSKMLSINFFADSLSH